MEGEPERVDWEKLRERLALVKRMLEQSPETAEGNQPILRERARQLAQSGGARREQAEGIETVEFLMSHEKYAIALSYVVEVSPLRELTPIPCTPEFVLGTVAIRGQIYSLVDLKKFFGLPQRGLADQNRVIVVREGDMEVGVLADEVLGTRHIPVTDLQTEFPGFTGIWRDFMKGVTGDRTILLNVPGILSDASIRVDQK